MAYTNIIQNIVSAAQFGAKPGNADNSTQLQAAIDYCIASGVPDLYIPSGTYNYSQSLKACNIYNGNYVGFGLNIYGDGDMWDAKTVLNYTGNSFAIGYQVAKGGSISRLKIQGNYIAPTNSGASYYNTAFPITGTAGIVIDYDGTKNTGGSTAFKVEDIWIDGFDALYDVSPNGVTFNADCLTFTNIRCGNGRVGFRSGQAQEKGNQINNIVSWGNLQTLISLGNSGKSQAGQYIIRNGNVAGNCVQLFDISLAGWNGFSVQGFYAESLGRLGTITTAVSVKPVASLSQMNIRFALQSAAGTQTLLTSNSAKTRLRDCNLWYYGDSGKLMVFSGPMTFDNCDFGQCTLSNLSATILN